MTIDLDRVTQAAGAIPRPFVGSPQYRSEPLSRLLGVELILKVETINPTGTVASRGAEWWFECHRDVHRVVCASADDFGVAMANAGRNRGIDVELFGPLDADPSKVESLRHAGTIVRLDGTTADETRAEAQRYSRMVDALFIDDGDHIELAEGAATMAAELDSDNGDIDAIFVPIGRGTLAHGTGAWCHDRMPRTRVVGVGAERAPGTVHSVREGRLVRTPVTPGAGAPEMSVSAPSELIVVPLSDALDDTALVNDRHLEQAAVALLAHEGIRASLDGSAALAAAALAAPDMRGARIVVPVTGRAAG
ncbi:MAG: PLP-dependent lyase/thiolase [Acidimicrobiales bacterium]|nr:PLP-dependent lyase/thiolase [Acidimicrobiales bacterium]